MTSTENIRMVPDPDFCVVLAGHDFPQATAFYWVTSGITTIKGDDIWVLISAEELEANGVKPGTSICFAAPVLEEFMRLVPQNFFVMWAKFAYIFVDLLKSKIISTDADGNEQKVNERTVVFHRIKDADAMTAANAYAKGLCWLIFNKQFAFKKVEDAPKIIAP